MADLLPILIATSAALFCWGLFRVFAGGEGRQRRRLAQRLSNEGRPGVTLASTEVRPTLIRAEVPGVPPALAGTPLIQALNRRLAQAYPTVSVMRFLAIAGGAAAGGFLLGFLFSIGSLGIGLLVGGVFGIAPFVLLGRRRAKRQKQIANQLPEALDFLSRVLKAGHSFSTGLQMMADELPKPISEEFRRCYDQHSLGQALEDALREAAARIDTTDFAFFVTALLIQRQTGGDLAEVLKNISNMIRSRMRLAQQVKAKTAEGRFTGYILVAFPAVMFMLCWVQNPAYCGKLLHGTGLWFLGTAFGLQMLGLWAIRKITTVKV
jgi:tight adherence protein B